MTVFYLDSSVALHALLGVTPAAGRWLEEVSSDPDVTLISSRLIRTELTRVLRRERLPVELRDAIVDRLELVPLTDAILAGAEAIVPHVRTLDAIHLASLVAVGFDASVVTHDSAMGAVAQELGYRVVDPVTD
ncbi:PIN domain-containing protein [Agrococcus citreus]|uniref:Ribonuclease VapC n=1 Tax=Agrococcus citreus TaxID=84643 RepID=A0ABP4JGJ7_9MICO